MAPWAQKKGPDGLEAYRRDNNLTSIDGFPTGLRGPGATGQEKEDRR